MRSRNTDQPATTGIRFNAISPSPVNTSLYSQTGIDDPGHEMTMLDSIRSGIPLVRDGRPEEIAGAVIYLASDASAFTVGQDLVLDGGQTPLYLYHPDLTRNTGSASGSLTPFVAGHLHSEGRALDRK